MTLVDTDIGKGRPWLGKNLPRRVPRGNGPPRTFSNQEINDAILDYEERLVLAKEWENRLRTADPTKSRSRFKDAQGFRRVCESQIESLKKELVDRKQRPALVAQSAPRTELAPDRRAPLGYEERAFRLNLELVVNCRVPQAAPLSYQQRLNQVQETVQHLVNSLQGQLKSEPDITDALIKYAYSQSYAGPFVDGALDPVPLGVHSLPVDLGEGHPSYAYRIQKPQPPPLPARSDNRGRPRRARTERVPTATPAAPEKPQ